MTPHEAYRKCKNQKKRIPELEDFIATDKICSYRYARDIIKRRWKHGEKNIVNDPEWSYRYARDVIEGPFYLGHAVIFNSFWKDKYINFLKSINYDLSEISEWLL